MSKAKITIEFNGKRYRVTKKARCASKRDCDLFIRGVCDCEEYVDPLPCSDIGYAFMNMSSTLPNGCFKEVR